MAGIAPNILTDRLRRLERERIVVATPYQQRPPRMSYALTADGHDLASALRLLADWGARRHRRPEPDPPRLDAGRRSRPAGTARPATSPSTTPTPRRRPRSEAREPAPGLHSRRWTTSAGNRACRSSIGRRSGAGASAAAASTLPPSLQGLPPRSVPEVAPTPLQKHYINLSVIVLICGAIAITALELGRRARQSPGQAVRAHRGAAPGRHDGRRGRPDLALGLGVDAGRSDQGPVPPGLGGGQPDRAGRSWSAPRSWWSSRDRA